jgi:hypothetical protein
MRCPPPPARRGRCLARGVCGSGEYPQLVRMTVVIGGAVKFTACVVMFAIAGAVLPAAAQRPPVSAPCADAAPLLSAGERAYCHALAQATYSAQPLLGALMAQGEAVPGLTTASVGTGGGIHAGIRAGAIQVRLPDVHTQQAAATAQLEHTAHAFTAAAALALFPGIRTAGVTGVGSVRFVTAVTWLPWDVIGLEGVAEDAARFAWGAGAVVGAFTESALRPSLSLSVMYRRLGDISYGVVCPPGASSDLIGGRGSGYDFVAGTCTAPADPFELSFDLSSWSGRAVLAKRVGAVGVSAGAGYDRHGSSVAFGLGTNAALPGLGERPVYVRASDLQLSQGRMSAFANVAVAVGRTGVAAEAGWLQGGRVVDGFDAAASAFNPAAGSLFGSVGVRVSF